MASSNQERVIEIRRCMEKAGGEIINKTRNELILIIAEELITINHYLESERFRKFLGKVD